MEIETNILKQNEAKEKNRNFESPPHMIDIQMLSFSRNLIYSYAIFDQVYF